MKGLNSSAGLQRQTSEKHPVNDDATLSEKACSLGGTRHTPSERVRATTITKLCAAGVNDRDVAGVSGHRNVASLASYQRRLEQQLSRMASVLDEPA